MIKKFQQSEFIRSVVTLMTGTVVAQVVAYLVYPILTRIYSNEDMGELGVYTRLVAFIAAFATARYEIALPIAKRDAHAFHLYRLSLRIAFITICSTLLVGALYYFTRPFSISNFAFLLMVILSAYITVWINLGTTWAIRKKQFKNISIQRMVNSLSVNALRWIFGVFGWGAFGLIFATLIGSFFSSIVFVLHFFRIQTDFRSVKNPKRMRVVASEFKQFPQVNLPHVLLDLGVDLALAAFIVAFYGKGVFGSFSHAYLMLKLPLAIVGQSIGQVFFSKCSDMVNKKQSIYPLMLKTIQTLAIIAVVPFVFLFLFGEPIFGFVFGDRWFQSGRFAEILAPYLLLNFLLSPVSSMPLILGRQREMFVIGICICIIQLVVFGLIPWSFPSSFSVEQLLWINSMSLSVVLLFVFYLYLRYAKIGKRLK